jgi:hypothetical protein
VFADGSQLPAPQEFVDPVPARGRPAIRLAAANARSSTRLGLPPASGRSDPPRSPPLIPHPDPSPRLHGRHGPACRRRRPSPWARRDARRTRRSGSRPQPKRSRTAPPRRRWTHGRGLPGFECAARGDTVRAVPISTPRARPSRPPHRAAGSVNCSTTTDASKIDMRSDPGGRTGIEPVTSSGVNQILPVPGGVCDGHGLPLNRAIARSDSYRHRAALRGWLPGMAPPDLEDHQHLACSNRLPIAVSAADMAISGCSLLVGVVVAHGKPCQERFAGGRVGGEVVGRGTTAAANPQTQEA